MHFEGLENTISHLQEMVNDGLITVSNNKLIVVEKGIPFVRNVCMAFDLHLLRNQPEKAVFSMTI